MLEGETATLVCGTDLTGNPLPNITWTDNNDRSIYLLIFSILIVKVLRFDLRKWRQTVFLSSRNCSADIIINCQLWPLGNCVHSLIHTQAYKIVYTIT